MSDSLPVCLQLISSSSALSASCSALPCLALPYILVLSFFNSTPATLVLCTLVTHALQFPPSTTGGSRCRRCHTHVHQNLASCLAEAYQVCATYSRCTIANRSLLISPNDRTHAERWWNSLIPTNEGGQILRNPRGIARRLKQVASIGTLLVAVSE